MPCYHTWQAFQDLKTGAISAVEKTGREYRSFFLPCNNCWGCRLDRSRAWAIRCVNEAQLHKENSFITLTYDAQHAPPNNSLNHSHFQKFMKRARRRYSPARIRFYMAGEYGEQFGRPHYHACLFGHDFKDKLFYTKTKSGDHLYTSQELHQLWPYGFSTVGAVTFETAAYTARYIMKKMNGDLAEKHYETIDPTTGEITQRAAEYNRMSLKPGIGANWLSTFFTDVYPHGRIVATSKTTYKETRPPRYYDNIYKKLDPSGYLEMKMGRELEAYHHREDNTPERLEAKERVAIARLSQLKRSIE